MLAAYHGHPDTVRALTDRGADVNRVNDRGQTPLAGAVFKGEDEVVELLVAAGADPAAGQPSAIDAARVFGRAGLPRTVRGRGAARFGPKVGVLRQTPTPTTQHRPDQRGNRCRPVGARRPAGRCAAVAHRRHRQTDSEPGARHRDSAADDPLDSRPHPKCRRRRARPNPVTVLPRAWHQPATQAPHPDRPPCGRHRPQEPAPLDEALT
jgi:ankyrin repeat protein